MIGKFSAAVVAAFLFVTPVSAQDNCGFAPALHAALGEHYGESVVDHRQVNEVTFYLYANTETGTWTLVGVRGDVMCGIGAGEDYTDQTIATIMDPSA